MRRFGVLLSGCGVQDGSEVHEATLTLYFLDRQGVARLCTAPRGPQRRVVDHLSGQEAAETREILTESARIARGEITPLDQLDPDQIDGLLIPGGFGAALNLCDYGVQGRKMKVREDVRDLLLALHEAGKPIGAICIAPVLVAKVFGERGVAAEVTIGSDPSVAADIESFGARHKIHLVDEVHIDRTHKIVTTPAYMLGSNAAEIGPGIEKLVEAVLSLT